jgi:flagella basal body P-ring formation protein FlgA
MKAFMIALTVALLSVAPALGEPAPARVKTGDGVRVVVPARAIARGDVISKSDLTYADVPAANAAFGVATSISQIEGKQTRRVLRAGEPVRTSDVRAPILVTKGSTVTMTFSAPGITLTAVGRAMSEGGLGESVTVLNPVSYRQITATVTGPGTVAAGDISTSISSDTAPKQLAAAQR